MFSSSHLRAFRFAPQSNSVPAALNATECCHVPSFDGFEIDDFRDSNCGSGRGELIR
jgi:hypothetical protein